MTQADMFALEKFLQRIAAMRHGEDTGYAYMVPDDLHKEAVRLLTIYTVTTRFVGETK